MTSSIPHQVRKRDISDPHPTKSVRDITSGEIVNVHHQQSTSSIEHTQFFNFQPQGSQVVLQNQPAQLDFIISASALAEVKFIALQMPIRNASLTDALELVPPHWFFNQIQILSGNQTIEQIWPEGIFEDLKYMTDEQIQLYATMTGNMYAPSLTERDTLGAAVAGVTTIPASSGREIWLILPNTFLQQTKIPLNSITSMNNLNVTFRFYFNTFSQVTASANTMTTVTDLIMGNMLLWLGGLSIGKNDTINFTDNHSYTFRQHERAIVPLGTIAPDGPIRQTLVNFNGFFSQVVAYPREQGATKEKVFQCSYSAPTYLPAEWRTYNSTLYDAANQPYSAVNLPYNLQGLAPNFIYDNSDVRSSCSTFPSKFPYVEWNLDGPNPWYEHYSGRVGGLYLNNNWQIVSYMNPAFTPKLTELVILGDRITELKVDVKRGIVVGVPQ